MSKLNDFKNLECWKEAKLLTSKIYVLTSNGNVKNDFGFVDQIRRASISIMNNVAEGFARFSPKELARFLNYSIGSCAEVQSMLHLGFDLGYLNKQKLNELHLLSQKLISKLVALKKIQKEYSP